MIFKNALCLDLMPDAGYDSWHLRCHRRADHREWHRVKFSDGKYRVWNDGDRKSKVVP